MRTAAILLPSPSLPHYWREDMAKDYDTVYAVNAAARIFPCDYACVLDRPSFAALQTLENPPQILTRGGLDPKGGLTLYGRKSPLLDISGIQNDGAECKYSTPCAVTAATKAGHDSIDLIGLDCTTDHYPITRWRNELPWLAYALVGVQKWTARGNIRKDWLQWLRNPQGKLPR